MGRVSACYPSISYNIFVIIHKINKFCYWKKSREKWRKYLNPRSPAPPCQGWCRRRSKHDTTYKQTNLIEEARTYLFEQKQKNILLKLRSDYIQAKLRLKTTPSEPKPARCSSRYIYFIMIFSINIIVVINFCIEK